MTQTILKKNGKSNKTTLSKVLGKSGNKNELFEEKQTAEYWEAAGVLEISLPESGTLDMEDLEGTLGDEEGDAYLKENEIHAVAAVTIRPEDYEKAKEVMLYIIEKLGGYFCGDTADFTPVVAAKKN